MLWYDNGYGSNSGSPSALGRHYGDSGKESGAAGYLKGYAVVKSGTEGHVGASAWQTGTPYNGPLAWATVLPSGYLADSPDVAANKIAHLGAVTQAYAEAAKWSAEKDGWKMI